MSGRDSEVDAYDPRAARIALPLRDSRTRRSSSLRVVPRPIRDVERPPRSATRDDSKASPGRRYDFPRFIFEYFQPAGPL